MRVLGRTVVGLLLMLALEETRHAVAGERDSLDVDRLSKAPKLKTPAQPVYPPAALGKGLAADVRLLLDLNDKGEVIGAALAEPVLPPDLGFAESALEAAYGLSFEPAEIDGQPVAVQVVYVFRFRPPAAPSVRTTGIDAGTPVPDGGSLDVLFQVRAPGSMLKGRLVERGTRRAQAGVAIVAFQDHPDSGVLPEEHQAATDSDGLFAISDLSPGMWTITIATSGYLPFKTNETVRVGEDLTVTYYLERAANNPYDVVVTSTRPRKEVSRTVVDRQTIDKVPGAASDPLSIVQDLAGVARVPLGQGQIIVRGSAPRDTRIFVAGAEIPTAYHFGGLRSVLPLAVVDSIDFYPGNFSVYYGRATGGIVDIAPKKLEPTRVGGYADVNLYDSGLYLEMPIGKRAMVAVAARRSYVDALLDVFFPSSAKVAFAAAPRYYDYQLLAQYRPAPGHDLRAMVFGSDDRFALLFKQPADFDPQAGGAEFGLSTSFYRSLLSYAYTPNELFSNTVRVSQGRNWLAFGIGVLSFNVDSYTSQLRDTARFRFGERLALALGVDVTYLRGEGTIALPPRTKEGQPPTNTDYSAIKRAQFSGLTWWSPALFAELEVRPWSSLLLVPGLRFDYTNRTHESTVEPRLSARQNLGRTVVAKAGVGLFHQAPDFGEDYPGFGNPKLHSEKAWHYSTGVEWAPWTGFSLDSTVFYKSLSDLVSPTTATTNDNGTVVPLIYDNGGRGRVLGVEMLLRRDFSATWTGWLAYTLSRSQRLDSGSDTWRLFDYDQTHILTALGTYRLGRNWTLGGRFRLVSGNPRTPVVGSVVNATADRYEPLFGPVNSARNPVFHQLDVRIDKRWVFNRWILDAYLDVQNVYNHRYAEGLQYSYDYSQSSAQSGLPLLTIFGVRGEI